MRFATSSVVLLLFAVSGPVSAETVFNSIDAPFVGGFYPDDVDQMLAQQFLLGSNNTVTSATVGLGGDGSPTGTINLEIWDDNGAGTPGALVGSLGSIDIATVNTGGGGGEYTFDSSVSGLTPNDPYYLVMSYQDIFMNGSNHVHWSSARRTSSLAAANALAAEGMVTTLATGDWVTTQNYPGGGPPFPIYNFASVEAVPEPSTAVLSLIGCLVMLARRRKRANRPRTA